ncbi:MAG: sigma-70 family RNA polymerase sigma factor [Balneolales bacterium]
MDHEEGQDYSCLSDEDLLSLYQNGLESAFTEIVNRYQYRLFRFMFNHTRNKMDSEDLVQDTFLRVSYFKLRFDPTRKFSGWVFTIALNLLRTNSRKKMPKQINEAYFTSLIDNEMLQDVTLHQNNLIEVVKKTIRHIPASSALLIYMRIMEEKSYKEIAEETNLPLGTIKSRISRAKVILRRKIRGYLEN